MCVPAVAGVASAVLTIGSAVSGYAGGQATDRFNRQLSERNQEIANRTALNNYQGLSDHRQQEFERAARDVSSIAADARRATSRVSAAANEAGVTGISVDQLIDDFERTEQNNIQAVLRTDEYNARRAELQKDNVRLGFESNLLSATPPASATPNLLSLASNVFGAGIDGLNAAGVFDREEDHGTTPIT